MIAIVVLLAVLGAWALAAVGLAFLAGGIVRVREERDVRASSTRVRRLQRA